MSVNPIEVVPYNHNWKLEFERIKETLENVLGDIPIAIEHVGSTSVEGLAAKPIIDIDVVIDSYSELPIVIELLAEIGLVHQGDLGIEGREAFKLTKDLGFMPFHLYVCPMDGKGYLEHIAFREYLRDNEWARNEYSELKYKLAEQYKYERDTYCDMKTEFIRDILNKTIYRDSDKHSHRKNDKRSTVTILSIVLLPTVLLFFVVYLFSVTEIGSQAMSPTIVASDSVVTFRNVKVIGPKIDYNKVIIFNLPYNPRYAGIGRVIGMPGDEIEIESGKVYVNGEELDEDYIEEGIETTAQTTFPHRSSWVVPEGEIFILGDNRRYNASYDSRNFGTIKFSEVRSIVVFHFPHD